MQMNVNTKQLVLTDSLIIISTVGVVLVKKSGRCPDAQTRNSNSLESKNKKKSVSNCWLKEDQGMSSVRIFVEI